MIRSKVRDAKSRWATRVALLLAASVGGTAHAGAPPTVRARMGVSASAWRDYPVRTVGDMGPLPDEPASDAYGGRLDKTADATGFFRTQKAGDRWWLVDPDGHLFLHVGVVSVSPPPGPGWGWAEGATRLLRGSGFNGVGAWSAAPALRATPRPLVYTVLGRGGASGSMGFLAAFGRTLGVTRPGAGHDAYRSDCLPVFHPGFAAFCDAYARPLAALKDDPYLLGYFSDNELPLPILDRYLALSPQDAAMASSLQAARLWLEARKGRPATVRDVTPADRDAWAEYVFDRYFALTTAAIRRYDPHHLCLGSRFYGWTVSSAGAFRAAGRSLDVIAVNDYGVWQPSPARMARWTAWSGRPVLITEFYAKGMDAGLPNTSGAGWTVPTQEDRGLFYQTFALGLLRAKNCVGWHWFKYRDNDPADRTADASNRDSNKGIVTKALVPYLSLLGRMSALNQNVYAVADRIDQAVPPAVSAPQGRSPNSSLGH